MTDRRWLAVTLVVLLVANTASNRWFPDADLFVATAVVLALLAIARGASVSPGELGLAGRSLGRGLRWGGAAALVVIAAYAVGSAIPAVRDAVAGSGDATDGTVEIAGDVLGILATTVVPEELAFRGLLLALLLRLTTVRRAVLLDSLVFGVWHVLPSLALGPANSAVVDIVGGDVFGTAIRVAGTVLVTGLAGGLLCWLRLRSDSLLAPVLAHWAVNGGGVLLVALAG